MAKAYVPQSHLAPFHKWLAERKVSVLLEVWLFCKTKSRAQMGTHWALKTHPDGLTTQFLLRQPKWAEEPFSRLNRTEVIRLHVDAHADAAREKVREKVVAEKERAKEVVKDVAKNGKFAKPVWVAGKVNSGSATRPKPVNRLPLDESALAFLLKKSDPEVALLYAEFRKGAGAKEAEDTEMVGGAAFARKKQELVRQLKNARRQIITQLFARGTSGSFWHTSEAADGLPLTALTLSTKTVPGMDLIKAAMDDGEGGELDIRPSTGWWFKQNGMAYFVVRGGPTDIARQIKAALELPALPMMKAPPPPSSSEDKLTREELKERIDIWVQATATRKGLDQGIFWFSQGTTARPGEIFIVHKQLNSLIDPLFGGAAFLTGKFSKAGKPTDPVTFFAEGASAGDKRLLGQLYLNLTRTCFYGSRPVKVQGRGGTFPAVTETGPSAEDLRRYAEFVRQTSARNKMRGPQEPSGRFWFVGEGLDKKPVFLLYGSVLPPGTREMTRSVPVTGKWTRNDAQRTITLEVEGSAGYRVTLVKEVADARCFPQGYRTVVK
jgi:hypothetical protein